MSGFFPSLYSALQRTLRSPRATDGACPDARIGAWIAASAFAFGILADLLFNNARLGINVPLWAGSLICVLLLADRRGPRCLGRLSVVLFSMSFVSASMVAWRASGTLHAALLTATVGFLVFGVVVSPGLRARRISLSVFFASLLIGAVSVLVGTFRLATDVPWRERINRGSRDHLAQVGRALLFALPLLLVFGALFMAADAVFEARLRDVANVNAQTVANHAGWLVGGTAAACGVLWCGLAFEAPKLEQPSVRESRRLRPAETAIILGSLSALFAVFVVIQVRYLFGGESHVQQSIGLTYAEYARRGFFELVAVAALVLPVLLAVDWARRRERRATMLFRALTSALVLLLLVIMASAIARLEIYIDAFGLTETRLYAALFLGWLAVVSIWLLWSLLRDRRDEFVLGTVATAALALLITVAVNPDGIVADTNAGRAEDGRTFDAVHAAGLSADAVPRLLSGLDALPDADACVLARSLLEHWEGSSESLRSWNWGRRAARQSVSDHQAELSAACE